MPPRKRRTNLSQRTKGSRRARQIRENEIPLERHIRLLKVRTRRRQKLEEQMQERQCQGFQENALLIKHKLRTKKRRETAEQREERLRKQREYIRLKRYGTVINDNSEKDCEDNLLEELFTTENNKQKIQESEEEREERRTKMREYMRKRRSKEEGQRRCFTKCERDEECDQNVEPFTKSNEVVLEEEEQRQENLRKSNEHVRNKRLKAKEWDCESYWKMLQEKKSEPKEYCILEIAEIKKENDPILSDFTDVTDDQVYPPDIETVTIEVTPDIDTEDHQTINSSSEINFKIELDPCSNNFDEGAT